MSEPNWVALGGGGVDYVGGWAAGTAYRAGDVVRHNGIEYLAVNPSTGQQPSPANPLLLGSEVDYVERTTDSATITVGTEATAVTIAQSNSVVFDGVTKYSFEFFSPWIWTDAAGTQVIISLWRGSTCLGWMRRGAGAWATDLASFTRIYAPPAGTHVHTVRLHLAAGGSALAYAGAGGSGLYLPSFLRISTVQPTAVSVRTFTAPGIGTTLPASPVDGDEYILVDSLTAPTYQWHFRYMASVTDAYKWVCVGGVPVRSEIATEEATPTTTYTNLTTVGPTVAVSRAGIYAVEIGCRPWYVSGSGAFGTMSYTVGAAAALDADGVVSSGNQVKFYVAKQRKKTLGAGDALVCKYKSGDGASAVFADRFLQITPVRVA